MKILLTYLLSEKWEMEYLPIRLKYLHKKKLIDYTQVKFDEYLKLNQDEFDVIIYTYTCKDQSVDLNTLIQKSSKKFNNFRGIKVLFDTSDNGEFDKYSMFPKKILRIKHFPSNDYIKKYNLLHRSTFTNNMENKSPFTNNKNKVIDVTYRIKLWDYSNNKTGHIKQRLMLRHKILDVLKNNKIVNKDIGNANSSCIPYKEYLSKCWISVVGPGWGIVCRRHLETLFSNTLLLAHEDIKQYKIIPGCDLIDGEDYVTFNLHNLNKKIYDLLSDKNEIKRISNNGHNKLLKYCSIEKTSKDLFEKIEPLLK